MPSRNLGNGVFFLIRMSSNTTFYTEKNTPLPRFREGIVYYWPKQMQDKNLPPLRGRLIRITEHRRKHDVWLFTNVEDRQQLPLRVASIFYRWRWESEGFFRTYKRTLKKVKLSGRTVRIVHREAEASMISMQLMLSLGALAMPKTSCVIQEPIMCSPRKVLLEIRSELMANRPRCNFASRLAAAKRERRQRNTAKEKRQWPRRKPHKPPGPPGILTIEGDLKSKFEQYLGLADLLTNPAHPRFPCPVRRETVLVTQLLALESWSTVTTLG